MIRIAITGPESSGKTTIARSIAEAVNGVFIPEYSREFLSKIGRDYSEEDLEKIAVGQCKANQFSDSTFVICDTEMIVMKIWSEVKYGKCHPTILNELKNQNFDYYFLCSPDIPWEADPMRENPNQREELFELYEKELIALKCKFQILQGSNEVRLSKALEIINSLKK